MPDKELTLKQKIENDAYEKAAELCECSAYLDYECASAIRALKHTPNTGEH